VYYQIRNRIGSNSEKRFNNSRFFINSWRLLENKSAKIMEVIRLASKKDLAIAVLITFCFTATLFMIFPSSSQSSRHEYDPWLDINDDGKIDIVDISKIALAFGTSGTPINKTGLLLGANPTADLPDLYEAVKDSVVMIVGKTVGGTVQGSGFVYNYSGTMVVLTNNHVVYGTTDLSVTFSDGDGYGAVVKGTDPYADFAVVTVNAPASEFKPIGIGNSSALRVGDPVIAIGNPYGLVGSMTMGVVSALGRTLTEEYTGNFTIGNIIQTSSPINPGNSGGPLLNYDGEVVGVTAAIVSGSQGLGFAIPSNTLLKEITALIVNGTYTAHSYLGVSGTDMDYFTAQQIGSTVTYGWRLAAIVPGGPSDGKLKVNDIIIAMNGTRIRNGDDLSSYLEGNTLPGETVRVEVMRSNVATEIPVVLGRRPSPPV
jgi:S1-C subfamily serine protease